MNTFPERGLVMAVCRKAEPGLPKIEVNTIQLITDLGVEGDYHAGKLVRHRYLAKKDPTKPNLRQVLLADTSIYADVLEKGIFLKPGMLGENILLEGIKVMELPEGAQLEVGQVLLELTGLRNPCYQLNEMHPALLKAVAFRKNGKVTRNAGMMCRILHGGWVSAGDPVRVIHQPQSP